MKIALVGPVHPFRGGIAHYTTTLHHELLDAGHEVLLLSFQRQYPRWLYPGRSDRDPSAEALTVPGARYLIDPLNPLSWVRAWRAIAGYRPQMTVLPWWQVFWAPAWLTLGWLLRMRPRTPLTLLCHNVLPHEQRLWHKPVTRAVLGLASQIVVQSTSEQATVKELLPDSRVEVVPHPLYDLFAEQPITRDAARASLGIEPDTPVLLFFGFVREYKGLRYLVDALPAVRREFPDVRLLVVGEFWEDRRIYERQIASLGLDDAVRLVDQYVPNEEVARYFRAADLVTLPYASATQSGVLQLALGFGLPVVATRVGGLAEAVVEGSDVVLVEPQDAAALAGAIISALAAPAETSGVEQSRRESKARWDSLVRVIARDDI